jgi:hypothetical protein
MAVCETTHWILDCGAGHGCHLVEYRDTGKLAGWGCNSEPVKGRPKLREGEPKHLDVNAQITFCCQDTTRAELADALSDLVPFELKVPEGKHQDKVSHCATGTLGEILAGLGFDR